jgi:transposase-like protein
MECTHCGSENYIKNGSSNFIRRYKCKNCNRSFGDKVRKFTYSDKMFFLELYLNNTGIRKSSKIIGCSPSLLVKWVRELSNNLRNEAEKLSSTLPEDSFPEVIEMDEIYTRVKHGSSAPGMDCF